MKKIALLITLIIFSTAAFCSPAQGVREFKMENGMSVFLLEDTSTPLVRIEYTARAGFSSQTQKTSGFFKLYSRVFQNSVSGFKFDEVQCNSDSSRYIVTVPYSKIESVISSIADTAFNPFFSDDLIKQQLAELKKEVRENFNSMSGFINAAIDSRVFSQAPWKHDSGVYPPIFNSTTDKNARSILSTISERWYTPQNSALFVSGNFNSSQMQALIQETFGRYYSTFKTPVDKPLSPINPKRKFVLHNPEFSDEMTQVVIQYLSLSSEECDIAATMFNNNYSYFKYNLLNQEELNIPGDEYIDASSAHKKDSSRLIIQTLIQPPENKKIKTNSLKQSELFIQQVISGSAQINTAEFLGAKQYLISNMQTLTNSSTSFMENLSAYWATVPYDSFRGDTLDNPDYSITTESLLSKVPKYEDVSVSGISYKLKNEEPFVFVIINSADYKKFKKEYTDAGFEEITVKNASWKNQSIFDSIKDQDEEEKPQVVEEISGDNNYYQTNRQALQTRYLKNGIPLITKHSSNSSDVAILISIRGGKIHSSNDHGFEEVMINILSNNIQREMYSSQQKGLISGYPTLRWQCDLTTSHITIECSSEDFANVAACISNAIIYSDIPPATADRSVSNRQYRKRLENGSAVNQLYSAAIAQLYPKTDFINIFETERDILETTNYQKILQYYPLLLDSSRYAVIVTGNFDPATVEQIMNGSMGLLSNQKGKINIETGEVKFTDSKTVTKKVNHTFLTDIPAEKAGPMPAVLIPTTEFLDPVIYINKAPKKGTKDEAIYNAFLLYLGKQLQEEINKNSRLKNATVTVNPTKAQMDTSGFTIQNVPHTRELDSTYKLTIQKIKKELQSSKSLELVQFIKDLWIQSELSLAYTNSGTAELLHNGFEYFPYLVKPEYYLEEYNFIQNAQVEDFMNILDFFPETPLLRVYSKEGLK